jgi:hypothetical protein
MARALLLLALPHVALSQSISSCGGSGDHFKDVKITLSPDPIAKGKPFTIDVTGTLDADLTALNADLNLDVKALGVINEPVKLSSPLSISPGIKAGAQSLSVGPLSLPSLPGSLVVAGTIALTNDKKEPVTCIKLNVNVPAESESLEVPEQVPEVSAEGSKVSVCSATSDHLHSLAWTTAGGVTTVTGSLDEAVTKLTVNADLKLKIGFLSHKIDLAVPVSYTPGLQKGDVKISVGPKAGDAAPRHSLINVDVTGTVKANDGASQEILCLSFDPAQEPMQTAASNSSSPSAEAGTCSDKGKCGEAYQACCAGFGAKGFPCGCHLTGGGTGQQGAGCGDCGAAYTLCCAGFKAKGFPCTCDVLPSTITV